MIKPGDIVIQNESELAVVLFTYTYNNKKHACTIPLIYSKEKNSPRYYHIHYIPYNTEKYNTLKFQGTYFYEIEDLIPTDKKIFLEEIIRISEFLLQVKYSVIDEDLFDFVKKELAKSLKKINKNDKKFRKTLLRDKTEKSLRLTNRHKKK